MKILENTLKQKLNSAQPSEYPDFERMWERLELAEQAAPFAGGRKKKFDRKPSRSWSKVTAAALCCVFLAAAPVYAAFQYDWSALLQHKDGVKAALAQNLGQPLNQTLTRDGVTLTLHTAIVDENRTIILYSLDTKERSEDQGNWSLQGLTLKGGDGKSSDMVFSNQQWDEENQRYTGYLESDWTPGQDPVEANLTINLIESYKEQQIELPLDSGSAKLQSFPIGRDGMKEIKIQAFQQGEDKLMLSTATLFDSQELKETISPQIVAYKNGEPVAPLPGNVFGTPGENGEYTSKQYFNREVALSDSTTFKLSYSKIENTIEGPWSFDLQLSKKQMESGTIRKALSLPLETGGGDSIIEQMVVTPTLIRVNIRSKEGELPYQQYQMEIDGRVLKGVRWLSPDNDWELSTLRFERPADLEVTAETPITLIGKYKVTTHEDKTPLQLTNISVEPQSKMREIGGYPVKWTYYMQDGDLFVETESEDKHFGGVNQTYIMQNNKRIIGRPVTVDFSGDGNNKAIDVYKGFGEKEASIYMFHYTIDEPEQETRVSLQ